MAGPSSERGNRRQSAAAGGDGAFPRSAPRGGFLTFRAGGESFAVELPRVREILQLGAFTRLPLAPAWVRGVMSLRGSVLSVVDLAAKLGLGKAAEGGRACIIVVEVDLLGEELVLGVLVDAVSQVVELSGEEIGEPPAFGPPIHLDYLRGMGRLDGELVLVLDIQRVLSERELSIAAGIEEAGEAEQIKADGDGGSGEESR